MPIHKVKGGYKWGSHGHTYPTREGAERKEQERMKADEQRVKDDAAREGKVDEKMDSLRTRSPSRSSI